MGEVLMVLFVWSAEGHINGRMWQMENMQQCEMQVKQDTSRVKQLYPEQRWEFRCFDLSKPFSVPQVNKTPRINSI